MAHATIAEFNIQVPWHVVADLMRGLDPESFQWRISQSL